MDVLFNKSCNL